MSYNTIIEQGRFTQAATATNIYLPLRSDWDWISVFNETAAAQAAADLGFYYYFQRGMTDGRGWLWTKLGTVANDPVTVGQIAANSGFFYIDSSVSVPGNGGVLTAITAANPPVVTTAATLPMVGDIVRFNSLDDGGALGGQHQIAGIDFTVTASGGGTFTIGNISLTNSTASTTGNWTIVPFDPIYYPRRRTITYISSEAQAKVYMSVTHGYRIGQKIRLVIPQERNGQTGAAAGPLYGDFAALNEVEATILDINVTRAGNEPNNGGTANNIRVDIDTSTFTTWNTTFGAGSDESFPAQEDPPFSPAQIVPIGEDTGYALNPSSMTPPIVPQNILTDATTNRAFIGVKLITGTASPGGAANDTVYWRAGKSFSANVINPLTLI